MKKIISTLTICALIILIVSADADDSIIINITSPSINPQVSGTATVDALLLNGYNADTLVQITIDGGSYQNMSSDGVSWQFIWDTTGYINGNHIITIYVKDDLGNIVSQTSQVIVENDSGAS